jgi:hypothetical protein
LAAFIFVFGKSDWKQGCERRLSAAITKEKKFSSRREGKPTCCRSQGMPELAKQHCMGLKMWGRYRMMGERKQMKVKREKESQRYQMKSQIGC